MNEVSVEPIDVPDPFPDLTTVDRCDKCGAQAKYRYLFSAGDLLFCQHHQRLHKDTIEATPGVTLISFGKSLD